MDSHNSANSVVSGKTHTQALQMAHDALQKCLLCGLPWSSDDFYSAMAVYRKVAGIEFSNDDDAILDQWLDGADAAWKQEIKSKGARVSLAEVLEKAIEGGMKAIGVRVTTKTPRKLRTNRAIQCCGIASRVEGEISLRSVLAKI